MSLYKQFISIYYIDLLILLIIMNQLAIASGPKPSHSGALLSGPQLREGLLSRRDHQIQGIDPLPPKSTN